MVAQSVPFYWPALELELLHLLLSDSSSSPLQHYRISQFQERVCVAAREIGEGVHTLPPHTIELILGLAEPGNTRLARIWDEETQEALRVLRFELMKLVPTGKKSASLFNRIQMAATHLVWNKTIGWSSFVALLRQLEVISSHHVELLKQPKQWELSRRSPLEFHNPDGRAFRRADRVSVFKGIVETLPLDGKMPLFLDQLFRQLFILPLLYEPNSSRCVVLPVLLQPWFDEQKTGRVDRADLSNIHVEDDWECSFDRAVQTTKALWTSTHRGSHERILRAIDRASFTMELGHANQLCAALGLEVHLTGRSAEMLFAVNAMALLCGGEIVGNVLITGALGRVLEHEVTSGNKIQEFAWPLHPDYKAVRTKTLAAAASSTHGLLVLPDDTPARIVAEGRAEITIVTAPDLPAVLDASLGFAWRATHYVRAPAVRSTFHSDYEDRQFRADINCKKIEKLHSIIDGSFSSSVLYIVGSDLEFTSFAIMEVLQRIRNESIASKDYVPPLSWVFFRCQEKERDLLFWKALWQELNWTSDSWKQFEEADGYERKATVFATNLNNFAPLQIHPLARAPNVLVFSHFDTALESQQLRDEVRSAYEFLPFEIIRRTHDKVEPASSYGFDDWIGKLRIVIETTPEAIAPYMEETPKQDGVLTNTNLGQVFFFSQKDRMKTHDLNVERRKVVNLSSIQREALLALTIFRFGFTYGAAASLIGRHLYNYGRSDAPLFLSDVRRPARSDSALWGREIVPLLGPNGPLRAHHGLFHIAESTRQVLEELLSSEHAHDKATKERINEAFSSQHHQAGLYFAPYASPKEQPSVLHTHAFRMVQVGEALYHLNSAWGLTSDRNIRRQIRNAQRQIWRFAVPSSLDRAYGLSHNELKDAALSQIRTLESEKTGRGGIVHPVIRNLEGRILLDHATGVLEKAGAERKRRMQLLQAERAFIRALEDSKAVEFQDEREYLLTLSHAWFISAVLIRGDDAKMTTVSVDRAKEILSGSVHPHCARFYELVGDRLPQLDEAMVFYGAGLERHPGHFRLLAKLLACRLRCGKPLKSYALYEDVKNSPRFWTQVLRSALFDRDRDSIEYRRRSASRCWPIVSFALKNRMVPTSELQLIKDVRARFFESGK